MNRKMEQRRGQARSGLNTLAGLSAVTARPYVGVEVNAASAQAPTRADSAVNANTSNGGGGGGSASRKGRAPTPQERARLSVYVPVDVEQQARSAYWRDGYPRQLSWSAWVSEALALRTRTLEVELNGGEPFEPMVRGVLPPGPLPGV